MAFDSGITIERFCQKYSGYEYILCSSFSHAPDDEIHKFRVVMPLKDRVRAIEIKKRLATLKELFPESDPTSFSTSQPFYVPSHPHGKTPIRIENQGEWFDLMRLEVKAPALPKFSSSLKVTADGDAAAVIAAIMNCMPPDTEYFRNLPGTNEHTYTPAIVPLLSSLGYWGRENGLDEEEILELILQRWSASSHRDSFYRIIARASYGGLEISQALVERIGRAIRQGVNLGIDQGDFKQARDHLYKTLSDQVVARELVILDAEVAKNKLRYLLLMRMASYADRNAPRNHLIIRFEAGAGKTEQAHLMLSINLYVQEDRYKKSTYLVVDYLVPNHALGTEIVDRLQKPSKISNAHIQHIQGREKLCIDKKVKEAKALGYEAPNPCDGCSHIEQCPYPKQYDVPPDRHLIRVISQQMIRNQRSRFDTIEAPDFYVIDEDIVASLYDETTFGYEYDFVKELPASISPESTSKEIAAAIRSKLTSEVNALELKKEDAPSLPAAQFTKFRNNQIDLQTFKRQIEVKVQKKGQSPSKRSEAACRSLLYDLDERPQAISVGQSADGVRQIISSRLYPLASRYAETPCIYLDATAENTVIAQALKDKDGMGREADYWECNVACSESVKVYQDTSRSWSMTSLCPGSSGAREVKEELLRVAWDEIVKRSILDKKRFAIITYKAVAEYIDSGRIPPGCADIKNSDYFCGVGYFGNIRGQDIFNQEGVQHLYVIGRMQVSPDTVQRYARAVFARDLDPLSFATHVVYVKVTPEIALKSSQYLDKRVQSVSNLLNSAETAQAAHRLRLIHGNEPKELFLLTNAVLPIRVNHTLCLNEDLTKEDRLLLKLRKSLVSNEVAMRVGTHWKSWPDCLGGMDGRMRRNILNRACDDTQLCTYHAYRFESTKKDRKKRTGIVLGTNLECCEREIRKEYPEDKDLRMTQSGSDAA